MSRWPEFGRSAPTLSWPDGSFDICEGTNSVVHPSETRDDVATCPDCGGEFGVLLGLLLPHLRRVAPKLTVVR